jgi:nucleotide-binding universal stress UspA family protein
MRALLAYGGSRQPSATSILLAADGSPSASRAEQLLAESPAFAGTPIRVVSVAEVVRPWHSGLAPTMHRQALARNVLQGAQSSVLVVPGETPREG